MPGQRRNRPHADSRCGEQVVQGQGMGQAFKDARCAVAGVGLGAMPLPGAEVIIDGTRKMLDEKWTYWQGPRFASSMPDSAAE